jgi:tRNA-specific 2-thiouridylase
MTDNEHIVVGISGGVDSAVAALRLLEAGYRVTAVFMKNWEEDDDEEYCAAAEDLAVATEVCAVLDIPLRTVNFASEYWDRVFQYFLDEYRAGRTPNPDVMCNKEIKFKAFLDFAMDLGANRIATGHYARVQERNGHFHLLRGIDSNKDQSYFLYTLGQGELSRSLFPLGDMEKPEVRQIAKLAGLPNYARKDSTGICFIGERRFKDFLARYLPAQPGEIRSLDDDSVLGQHDGLMYHTLGQRQGLGIGGAGDAWYVARKDLERNILYVVQGQEHPALYNSALVADTLYWTQDRAPELPMTCSAKTRYRQQDQACTVQARNSGNSIEVVFDQAQRAITPGQSVVLYNDDECLGGGIIHQSLAS